MSYIERDGKRIQLADLGNNEVAQVQAGSSRTLTAEITPSTMAGVLIGDDLLDVSGHPWLSLSYVFSSNLELTEQARNSFGVVVEGSHDGTTWWVMAILGRLDPAVLGLPCRYMRVRLDAVGSFTAGSITVGATLMSSTPLGDPFRPMYVRPATGSMDVFVANSTTDPLPVLQHPVVQTITGTLPHQGAPFQEITLGGHSYFRLTLSTTDGSDGTVWLLEESPTRPASGWKDEFEYTSLFNMSIPSRVVGWASSDTVNLIYLPGPAGSDKTVDYKLELSDQPFIQSSTTVLVSDNQPVSADTPLPVRIKGEVTIIRDSPVTVVADSQHPLPITIQTKAGGARRTTIQVGTAPILLLAENADRLNVVLHNHSDGQLLLSLGPSVGDNTFTQVLQSHAYYELPSLGVYSGVITARRPDGSATGPVMVTELVPDPESFSVTPNPVTVGTSTTFTIHGSGFQGMPISVLVVQTVSSSSGLGAYTVVDDNTITFPWTVPNEIGWVDVQLRALNNAHLIRNAAAFQIVAG